MYHEVRKVPDFTNERSTVENDDEQVGRLLTRREALALMGLSGAAVVTMGAAAVTRGGATGSHVFAVPGALPSCVVRPEQTEGPFFVDRMLERVDIRSDPATGTLVNGARLDLQFNVSRIGSSGCTPLPGAQIDLWQCDARGLYSAVTDRRSNTEGERFLRGYQITDEAGRVRFTTIYPGWYQGRAVHIHFKIRTDPGAARGQEFVSQLYFDDALTDRVHSLPAYGGRGQRDRRNDADGIFRRGGDQLMLALQAKGGDAYEGSFDIGLQL
jgi:protocatechuate 3,4-dioxygenase beta subunit